MSRLTCRLSGVTYVLNPDTLAPTKLTYLRTDREDGRQGIVQPELAGIRRELG
jgi:hypothetical protein